MIWIIGIVAAFIILPITFAVAQEIYFTLKIRYMEKRSHRK